MYRTIAFTTALTVLATLAANPAAAAGVAQLLQEEHYSDSGYEVDLYVTRGADGDLLSETTIFDPASGDAVDVWTDGATVWWYGAIEGEPVRGSIPAPEVTGGDPPPEPICFTPVTAIICLGVVVAAAASCAHTSWCVIDDETEVPGGQGGVPEDGGDGDEGGDSGKTGGGDED